LRNGVLVISDADSKAAVYVDVTLRELADFVFGKGRRRRAAKRWPSWIVGWIEAGCCRQRRPPRRCSMRKAT
jgi:hypothetical protein